MRTKDKYATARRALTKKVNIMFTRGEQQRIEWSPDRDDQRSYTWRLVHDGHRMELVYGYVSKTVTVCGVRA